MQLAQSTVAGLAVASMVLGAAITGCGSDNESSPSSSSAASSSSGAPSSGSSTAASPSAAQPTDYSALLIKASDVGPDFTTPDPPTQNPGGSTGAALKYINADGSRRLYITIIIKGDPAQAPATVEASKGNYTGKISGTWQPADVGSNGAMIAGTTPDNSKATTAVLFSEGKAIVNMEFDSAPNDPIAADAALDIARKQDTAIKNGLPS